VRATLLSAASALRLREAALPCAAQFLLFLSAKRSRLRSCSTPVAIVLAPCRLCRNKVYLGDRTARPLRNLLLMSLRRIKDSPLEPSADVAPH
jgi:hypothetical protein